MIVCPNTPKSVRHLACIQLEIDIVGKLAREQASGTSGAWDRIIHRNAVGYSSHLVQMPLEVDEGISDVRDRAQLTDAILN